MSLTLDPEDFEALGFGDVFEALALSGWAERRLAAAQAAARTPEARAYQTHYRHTPEGHAALKVARAHYQRTPKGKGVLARANARYQHTEAGKASMARARAKYRASPKGRKARALAKQRARDRARAL